MTDPVKIVQPSGILDGTKATSFREEINQLVEDKTNKILIDFSNATFMDSSGLGALVLSLKKVREAGGELFICSINDQIKMLFELTSMDRVFKIFDTREAFEQTVSSQN